MNVVSLFSPKQFWRIRLFRHNKNRNKTQNKNLHCPHFTVLSPVLKTPSFSSRGIMNFLPPYALLSIFCTDWERMGPCLFGWTAWTCASYHNENALLYSFSLYCLKVFFLLTGLKKLNSLIWDNGVNVSKSFEFDFEYYRWMSEDSKAISRARKPNKNYR